MVFAGGGGRSGDGKREGGRKKESDLGGGSYEREP